MCLNTSVERTKFYKKNSIYNGRVWLDRTSVFLLVNQEKTNANWYFNGSIEIELNWNRFFRSCKLILNNLELFSDFEWPELYRVPVAFMFLSLAALAWKEQFISWPQNTKLSRIEWWIERSVMHELSIFIIKNAFVFCVQCIPWNKVIFYDLGHMNMNSVIHHALHSRMISIIDDVLCST